MANYYVYATDDSASTNGVDYFNTKGLETLKTFKDEVKALQNDDQESSKDDVIVYLHWSKKCVRVEENEVVLRYTEKNGMGTNTLPKTVTDWLVKNLTREDKVQLLYVITDGAVHRSKIKPCDPNMKIDKVTFHAFNSNIENIDMSVASMFICNNKRYITHCNGELVDEADLSTPFNYDELNIEKFLDKKKDLKSYIKLKFLNKNSTDQMALEEIKKLKRLQASLYEELQASETKPDKPIDLNVKDKDIFFKEFKRTKYYKTLFNLDRYNEKLNIEKHINTLINYINNDKKSFEFDNLKFSQKFTQLSEEKDVFHVKYGTVEEIPFPDIIMSNDKGVPVILLTHCSLIDKILFNNVKKVRNRKAYFSRFRNTVTCPLILLQNGLITKSIEYYYNLEAFKSMIKHGMKTGPRTRKEFTGAIVPMDEFDDYNDYVLSCTYFDKRRVPYNKGLLYYVLYKTCEKLEYIEPNVVEYLKGYVVKRIAKTKCNLSLSDVSIDDPKIRVNLTTALWYCVELSSILFKNDPIHFTKEKMRMYSHLAEYMKEILGWFKYHINVRSVNLRADIFKHLNKLKRISRPEDKAMFILEQIFKKEYVCDGIDGFLVAEIENRKNLYKLIYLEMDHKDVIDESVISSKYANRCIDKLCEYAHVMNYVETTDIPICKQTLRPYFVTRDQKSFYEQLILKSKIYFLPEPNSIKIPVYRLNITKVLSAHNLYISYVERHLQFPSMEEYKLFVFKKKKYFRRKPVIFAINTLATLEKVYNTYNKIIFDTENPIDVDKFIDITKKSANIENRIKLENPIDFKMDEMTNYIQKSRSYLTRQGIQFHIWSIVIPIATGLLSVRRVQIFLFSLILLISFLFIFFKYYW